MYCIVPNLSPPSYRPLNFQQEKFKKCLENPVNSAYKMMNFKLSAVHCFYSISSLWMNQTEALNWEFQCFICESTICQWKESFDCKFNAGWTFTCPPIHIVKGVWANTIRESGTYHVSTHILFYWWLMSKWRERKLWNQVSVFYLQKYKNARKALDESLMRRLSPVVLFPIRYEFLTTFFINYFK